MTGKRFTSPSPFLPVAVAGHVYLLWAWASTPPPVPSMHDLAGTRSVMTSIVRWMPASATHPLLLWGLLSGLSGVLLLLGAVLHSRVLRMAGWTSGSGVLAFIAMTYLVALVTQPGASRVAPGYALTIVGAHMAAASRESG